MYEIKNSRAENAAEVNALYEAAKLYFKQNNINQWQNGYPNAESFLNDVKNGESFIVLKSCAIAAGFMYSERPEPTYAQIFSGKWQFAEEYAVIHRVAVSPLLKGAGIMAEIVKFAAQTAKRSGCAALRCDTHEHNLSMQRALLKNGFVYSGIIFLDEKQEEPRLAYEKAL